MRQRLITIPELAFIGATRGMLGAGIGLLVAGQLTPRQRRAVGIPLFTVGAVSTIPILIHLFRKPSLPKPSPALERLTEQFVPSAV
jgi:hypothetical protein